MAIQGSCHCGKTRFEIDFVPRTAKRCTCTFCTKRGVLWASVPPGQLRLLTPREDAKAYGRNPLNRHYFCATCGCGTFSETPDWTAQPFDPNSLQQTINLRALDDFDIDALPVEVIDGRNLW